MILRNSREKLRSILFFSSFISPLVQIKCFIVITNQQYTRIFS